MSERGLSATPALNVVENDGYGEGATHTRADKDPTPAELDRMRALVRQGMREGAVGVASGVLFHLFLGPRGHLDEGELMHFQVTMKVGFRLDDDE